MSAEQQLERSVLERKERDELHAISEAMGLKPASRTKKSDLIDGILRVAGVMPETEEARPENGTEPTEEPGGAEKPRRTRVPRAAKTTDSDPEGTSSGSSDVQDDESHRDRTGSTTDSSEASSADQEDGEDGTTQTQRPGRAGPRSSADTPSAASTAASRWGGSAPASSSTSYGRASSAAGPGGTSDRVEPDPADRGNDRGNDRANDTDDSDRTGGDDLQRPPRGDGEFGRSAGARNESTDRSTQPRAFEGPGEPGNRRNRRRRGRERGPERTEPQGGGQEQPFSGEPVPATGLLDLRDEGFGFLRANGYLPSPRDVYISMSQVRRFALRKGDYLEGASRPASSTEKYPALLRIDTVNGMTPDEARLRPRFEDLTPLFPDERLHLEVPGDPANVTARIVDLLSPIGKGQRGLIVSPPKAGKTTVLKQIAHSIEANNADVHLMVLLVDERPEEVTDMRRSVKGEIVASTFDRPSEEHTQVAELAIERAKRLVETGRDVVIILDGITRLARAYNLAAPASGRILSGGVDSAALYPPKKFFGSARNIEEGGSLTILATALVETGSRMDEVIFEEFKGTGNMELRLDRKLAERRLYPAIDVNASSTRHEELLFDRSQLQQVWKLRRVLNALGSEGSAAAGLELLMDKIKATRSNDEFLSEIAKGPAAPI